MTEGVPHLPLKFQPLHSLRSRWPSRMSYIITAFDRYGLDADPPGNPHTHLRTVTHRWLLQQRFLQCHAIESSRLSFCLCLQLADSLSVQSFGSIHYTVAKNVIIYYFYNFVHCQLISVFLCRKFATKRCIISTPNTVCAIAPCKN